MSRFACFTSGLDVRQRVIKSSMDHLDHMSGPQPCLGMLRYRSYPLQSSRQRLIQARARSTTRQGGRASKVRCPSRFFTVVYRDSFVDPLMRHRVPDPIHADRGVPADPACLASRDGDRILAQHVLPRLLLAEQVVRNPLTRCGGVFTSAQNAS